MKAAATVQTQTAKSETAGIANRSALFMQRKCACGGSAGLSGKCRECQEEELHGKPLQAKLRINQPGDEYEQEAERVAKRIVGISEPSPKSDTSGIPPIARVQREVAANGSSVEQAPPIVYEVLSSPGKTMDTESRAFFEPRFGYDFRNVRVHSDARAAESVQAIDARAYTVGNHVVLGSTGYSSCSTNARLLLGHELAHVIQQEGTKTSSSLKSSVGRSDIAKAQRENATSADNITSKINLGPHHLIQRAPSPASESPPQTEAEIARAEESFHPASVEGAMQRFKSELLSYLEPTLRYYDSELLPSVRMGINEVLVRTDLLNLFALYVQTADPSQIQKALEVYIGVRSSDSRVWAERVMTVFYSFIQEALKYHSASADDIGLAWRFAMSGAADNVRPFRGLESESTQFVTTLLNDLNMADVFMYGFTSSEECPSCHSGVKTEPEAGFQGVGPQLNYISSSTIRRRDAIQSLIDIVKGIERPGETYDLIHKFKDSNPADRQYFYENLLGIEENWVDDAEWEIAARSPPQHPVFMLEPPNTGAVPPLPPDFQGTQVQWELASAIAARRQDVRNLDFAITVLTIGGSIGATLLAGALTGGAVWAMAAAGSASAAVSGAVEVHKAREKRQAIEGAGAARHLEDLPLSSQEAFDLAIREEEATKTAAVGNVIVAGVSAPAGGLASQSSSLVRKGLSAMFLGGLDGLGSWVVDPRLNDEEFLVESHRLAGGEAGTAPTPQGTLAFSVGVSALFGLGMEVITIGPWTLRVTRNDRIEMSSSSQTIDVTGDRMAFETDPTTGRVTAWLKEKGTRFTSDELGDLDRQLRQTTTEGRPVVRQYSDEALMHDPSRLPPEGVMHPRAATTEPGLVAAAPVNRDHAVSMVRDAEGSIEFILCSPNCAQLIALLNELERRSAPQHHDYIRGLRDALERLRTRYGQNEPVDPSARSVVTFLAYHVETLRTRVGDTILFQGVPGIPLLRRPEQLPESGIFPREGYAIPSLALPEAVGIRSPRESRAPPRELTQRVFRGDPPNFAAAYKDIPQIQIDAPLTGRLVSYSEVGSGSTAVVYLTSLRSGDPTSMVAVKLYNENILKEKIESEAVFATLVGELGIGPRVHGIANIEGRIGLVMEPVAGDFPEVMPVGSSAVEDLNEAVRRLLDAGFVMTGDFQFFVSPDGRAIVIDVQGWNFRTDDPSFVRHALEWGQIIDRMSAGWDRP